MEYVFTIETNRNVLFQKGLLMILRKRIITSMPCYICVKFRMQTRLTTLCSFAEGPLMILITSVCNIAAILGINGPQYNL